MKIEEFKPTLRARLQTLGLLLELEASGLEGYVRERDREAMAETLLAGWREVMKIKARATVHCMLEERAHRQSR